MSLGPGGALYQPRRPASRPERRSGQQQQPQQVWTAARCHRLLRPLVSRIAILRKEAVAAAASFTSVPTAFTSLPASQSTPSHEGVQKAGAEESEWLVPRKKRARLTYSQRRPSSRQVTAGDEDAGLGAGRRVGGPGSRRTVPYPRSQTEQQRRTAPPGEIVPPTPLLRRARGHMPSSPVSAPANADTQGLGFQYNNSGGAKTTATRREPRAKKGFKDLEERLAKLRAQMPPERHADLEAIYRSLEVLLKATGHDNEAGQQRMRGPRSFLAMCLRRVPEYIAELEAWERWDAEQGGTVSTLDDIDTSAQIYDDLESLGPSKGWRHLRVVVRADGLKAIREGLSERLFSDEFSQLLIDLCVQMHAFTEAQELIEALVDRQYPLPVSADSSFAQLPALQPLLSLTSYANRTGRASFLLQQCSILLSNNNLPQDWLATLEFERVWGLAARALCSTKANSDVVTFMTGSISLLCSRKRTFMGSTETIQTEKDMLAATQRTLTSALTILATMSLLGENEFKSSYTHEAGLQRVLLIGNRLRYILKACIAGLESQTRTRTNTRVDMVYLALLLSSGRSQGDYVEFHVKGSIMNIWKHHHTPKSARDGRTRNNSDSLVSLISSIARSYSRGTSVASHQCLEDLFDRLAILDTGHHILDSLKGATAFLLAQQTSNVKDLIYAEKLNPLPGPDNGSGGDEGSYPTGRTFFTGYRWEEAIGEWVAVSPVASKKQSGTKRSLRSSSSSAMMTTRGVNHAVSDAETALPTRRSTSSIRRRDTGSVADAETAQGGDVGSVGSGRQPHRIGLGHRAGLPARKRTYRASRSYDDDDDSDSDESLATTQRQHRSNVNVTTPEPKHDGQALPRNTHIRNHYDDELGEHDEDDKENRAKRRRRSSGKVVALGTMKSRTSLSNRSLRDNVYSSDDELCI